MSIESKIPTEEINIQHLQVEASEKQVVGFDYEKEITQKDMEGMLLDLKKARNNQWIVALIQLAGDVKLLFPEQDLGLDDQTKKLIKETLSLRIVDSPGESKTCELLVNAKQLIPEEVDKILNSYPVIWKNIKTRVNLFRTHNEANKWEHLINNYIWAKTLFPQKYQQLGLNKDEILSQLKSTLNPKSNDLLITSVKLSGGEDILRPILKPEYWTDIKEVLEKNRKAGGWPSFARWALVGKILAANETHITPGGWVIGKPFKDQISSASPTLPEIKKF